MGTKSGIVFKLFAIGLFVCAISCQEDNPKPLTELVKSTGNQEVEFELYTKLENAPRLVMELISEEKVSVNYQWYKEDKTNGDQLLTSNEVTNWGGHILLEYVFTEKQFEKDFPLHSLSSQRYYCKAIVNKTDNTDQLELCDTLFVKPVLPAGLTSLWVKTENNEEPTCDLIEAPAGGISISITNATKVPGRVWIKAHDEIVYDSGDYKKDESGMTIKIRGNSSAMADKKPFKIKLQKKYDMLSRGEEYADKDWVLLSTGSDLNTFLGLKISSYANFHWVPKMKFCNLVVNDVYRGLYILTEQVERDTKCRINVDKDGYLIEYDAYWWNEPLSFKTSMYSSVLRYTFKYPDPEDITEEQFAYISDYVHLCEQKIQQGEDYENYID